MEGSDEHTIVLNVHHIAIDGWSFRMLSEDIDRAYSMLVSGRAVELGGEPELRYADYAQWQRQLLDDSASLSDA